MQQLKSSDLNEKWATLNMLLTMITFIVVVLALSITYLHEEPSNLDLLNISTFFDLRAFFYYNSYLLFTALLAVLPFGGVKVSRSSNQKEYDVLTGGLSLISCLFLLFGLEMFGFNVVQYISKNMFYLTTAALLSGLSITTYVHIRSYSLPSESLNPKIIGKNGIQGFFLGREVRPRIFGVLDLKIYFNRIAILTMVLLDCVFLYESFILSWQKHPITLNKTLIVLSAIKFIYFVDGLLMEYTYETSMEVRQLGFYFGCGVGNFIYPFLMSIFTKHLIRNKIEFENWRLVLTCVVFVGGFLIYRISNNQKYNFRNNPTKQGFKSIPTGIKDKKLLCSGLWGVVRHPNYLGDILVHLSFIGFMFCVPAFMVYFDVLFLLDRSSRDNQNCKEKYGNVWDQYCKKVKYILIPRIY